MSATYCTHKTCREKHATFLRQCAVYLGRAALKANAAKVMDAQVRCLRTKAKPRPAQDGGGTHIPLAPRRRRGA